MAKRKKTLFATEIPTIKYKNGMFITELSGMLNAFTPDMFVATHAAAGRAIREWQEATAKDVIVLLRKRDEGH